MKHRIGCWRGVERFAAALNETCSDELWVGRRGCLHSKQTPARGKGPGAGTGVCTLFYSPAA